LVRDVLSYIKACLIAGIIMVIGLNTAAQGLQRMAPDMSEKIIECRVNNNVLILKALGKSFICDMQKGRGIFDGLKARAMDHALKALSFFD